ncbi:MAG TPA: diaminobutyrate--2-oxoglutarate transaminase [Verrucomicrobiae bacterium]|nr:diaminobutyrate--2-oxoglutarate transaminase [Verrucomicrobiae bacterium]
MNIFEHLESEVRSYCRAFPTVLRRAQGSFVYDESGREYLDFFAGAGTLNYGHNNPVIKQAVIEYLQQDGILHALDLMTVAKREFLETFEHCILKPRGLDYKIQFTGPTGTNAVEAALKLARKVKGRTNVISFTNGYHGLSAGALAATGNRHFRTEQFLNRLNVSFMPFDGYLGENLDTLAYLRRVLKDNSSGTDLPAAVILETVQAEGGVNVARAEWLQGLAQICREFDILLIADDIQVGNGRTGSFFSFEAAGIRPDMVVLSKAIGGIGLPMSLVLINREIDNWKPAEHTGTFRGNNLAFVAAKTAIQQYWSNEDFSREIQRKETLLRKGLEQIAARHRDLNLKVRGRGLIYGIGLPEPSLAKAVSRESFKRGLIIELAGSDDQVVKFLPPLTVQDAELQKGLEIVSSSLDQALADRRPAGIPVSAEAKKLVA